MLVRAVRLYPHQEWGLLSVQCHFALLNSCFGEKMLDGETFPLVSNSERVSETNPSRF